MAKIRKSEPVFRFTLPPMPEKCADCGRKLDGRMLNNPYGVWSVPVMLGSTGETVCSYCEDMRKGWDPQKNLKPGCEALKQLAVWLGSEVR